MAVTITELSTGWQVKQADDNPGDAWLPARKLPTVIHLDLQENGKYVKHKLAYAGLTVTA
jgi:hypothetical protein